MGVKKKLIDLAVKGADELGEMVGKATERTGARAGERAVGKRTLGQIMDTLPPEARPSGKTEKSLAVPNKKAAPKPKPVVKALPAPPKPLALPAPGPEMPEFAAKPRGGQWWTENSPYGLLNPAVSSKENVYLGARFSSDPTDKALAEWWDKVLPRYIQNDFATPEDPLRALADQGYLQDVENAAQWSNRVKRDVIPMPMQKLLFDEKAANVKDEALAAMPWLSKLPQTDTIYGFWPREETIGALSHIRDEMVNALKPDLSGIPADLAVRPDSLGRMSFAQAAERVGKINQWRAKQREQAALSAMDSPVVHTFKEYADDNPMGLRWVEMAPPKGDGPTNYDIEEELGRALRYEGDTMGHCVGGYCPDVMSGRSRIFSLRDAKGEPHVTVETRPGNPTNAYRAELARMRETGELDPWTDWLRQRASDPSYQPGMNGLETLNEWRAQAGLEPLETSVPDDIIQIKGKQNRAPKDDYLPFVQDFVKSQKWSNVGDLGNTGLVRLPDGRYITAQQYEEARARARSELLPGQVAMSQRPGGEIYADNWDHVAPYFEGYAIGGRVERDRCFCRHPMSVR